MFSKMILGTIMALGLASCQPAQMAIAQNAPQAHMNMKFGKKHPDAPEQLNHMASLIGDWALIEEQPNPDGSGWVKAQEAEWSFAWGLGGWSIVDDYIGPALHVPLEDETTRQRGTNVRIFNATENKWVMSWITIKSKQPVGFTAISDEETVVMKSDTAYFQNFFVRIMFFDMQENTFDWKMEISKDGETAWNEVYRIHGTRVN